MLPRDQVLSDPIPSRDQMNTDLLAIFRPHRALLHCPGRTNGYAMTTVNAKAHPFSMGTGKSFLVIRPGRACSREFTDCVFGCAHTYSDGSGISCRCRRTYTNQAPLCSMIGLSSHLYWWAASTPDS
jgi:hypothetical protein